MTVMRVLGIDAGRDCGVALLDVDLAKGTAVCIEATTLRRDGRLDEFEESLENRPQLVAVELPEGHAYAGRTVATIHLAEAARIGGELAGFARGRGLDVVTTNAADVRRDLCGRGNVSNHDVAQMLRLRCPSWPRRSNNHARDAGAVAIWAALRPAAAMRRAEALMGR